MSYMNIKPLNILRIVNKRWLVLIALFACALLPLHAASLNELTYTTTDGKVTITDCNKAAAGELVIPETIEGNPVTSIGELAFSDCFYLREIKMPNSVVSIGNQAFARCFDLEKITIPNGIVSIGEKVFFQCVSLKSITIPDSVISIKRGAFERCVSLDSITIPKGVTSIGDGAFQHSSLNLIIFKGNAPEAGPDAFKFLSRIDAYVSAEARSSFGDYWNGLSIKVGDGPPNPEPLEDDTSNALATILLLFLVGFFVLLRKMSGSGSSRGSSSGGEGGGSCGGGGGCGGGCGG
jgi:hypothetical protein